LEFGNFYNGTYVAFLSIEYSSSITVKFQMQTLSYFQKQAKATNSSVYLAATSLIVSLNNFVGPVHDLGQVVVLGAGTSEFGDTTTVTNPTTTLPISSMTHDQVLASFTHPTTKFAWKEYAAADCVALVCASFGQVCRQPWPRKYSRSPSISTMTAQARG